MIKRLYEHHYVEEQRKYRGIEYTILFNKSGWRTAYLNVTGSVLQNVDYNNIDLDVHGGLTYSNDHLPFERKTPVNREFWYIGWDYAHLEDGCDPDKTLEYFGTNYEAKIFNGLGLHCYSLEEVRNDCIEAINELHITGGKYE